MRVLVLDQFSEIGGGQMCLLDLLPALRDRNFKVHAAVPSPGPYSSRLLRGGATVDFFGSPATLPIDIFRQSLHFASLVHRSKPDLIYVNGPRVFPAAALAAGPTPLLFHAHSHLTQKLAQMVVTCCLNAHRAAMIACSRSVADRYQPHLTNSLLSVVPNGVPDLGYLERFTEPLRKPRIGIVGRIVPGKGHLTFLECARLLAQVNPDFSFSICGSLRDAPKAYAADLVRSSQGLAIHWLGWQDNLTAVLHHLDLLVIPSSMEGMPRVMLEAFSAGVPVVAFPVGGIPEVIRDRVTGFLVSDLSVRSLTETIQTVLTDHHLLRAVSRNARLAWECTYNVHRYRSEVMQLVELAARQ